MKDEPVSAETMQAWEAYVAARDKATRSRRSADGMEELDRYVDFLMTGLPVELRTKEMRAIAYKAELGARSGVYPFGAEQ